MSAGARVGDGSLDSRSPVRKPVPLEGEFGHEGVGVGVPAKLGSSGIEEVVEWELSDVEREQLQAAADKLDEQYEKIS